MADLKTKQNDGNVMHFLRTVEHDERREGAWFKAGPSPSLRVRASSEPVSPSMTAPLQARPEPSPTGRREEAWHVMLPQRRSLNLGRRHSQLMKDRSARPRKSRTRWNVAALEL